MRSEGFYVHEKSTDTSYLMVIPLYYTGSSFVGYEHCVIWQIVPDVLKALHSFKMVITIYKLAQHNILEDLNLNIQQQHWKNKNLSGLTPSAATGGEVKNGWNCKLVSACAHMALVGTTYFVLCYYFPF